MSGTSDKRTFSDEDRAQVLATLAANGGNVKRTARETSVLPATIRSWRRKHARGEGVSVVSVTKAVEDFVKNAVNIRDKAMVALEARIDNGEIRSSELITTIGVLDDKITRARGLPTQRTEHLSALPPREELRGLMEGFVAGAISAAERRQGEIVEAEIVEVRELPTSVEQPQAGTP